MKKTCLFKGKGKGEYCEICEMHFTISVMIKLLCDLAENIGPQYFDYVCNMNKCSE